MTDTPDGGRAAMSRPPAGSATTDDDDEDEDATVPSLGEAGAVAGPRFEPYAAAAARPVERRTSGAHRATRREGERSGRYTDEIDNMLVVLADPATARGGTAARHRFGLSDGVAPDVARGGRLSRWYIPEAAVAWVAGRVVVAAALGLVHFLAGSVSDNGGRLDHSGLLGWDAGWYESIATHGYGGAGEESRRFFPLLPMLVRALCTLPGLSGHEGAVLLVVVNALAFALTVLLARLARAEGFPDPAIRRVIWLSALAPPAFVLAMGYAEALAMVLAVGAFLAARSGRFWLAALAGLLGGLCRPLGLLLVAPMLIEAARGPRSASPRWWLPRFAAVVAPAAGAGIYVAWSATTYHDGLAPLTMQRDAARHGAAGNPLSVLWDAAQGTLHGEVGTGLHVPWLLLALVALVLMARLLPASYPVWCGLVLLTVFTGSNLDSSERYVFGAFPFVLVAALALGRRTVWPFALAISATVMTVYATLAFTLAYVP
ncbi:MULTISPECIES: mannosyltransferase family protein [Pseudofrankia]|uniref:mannosyltransferase family protein n=1 Tax=Pseudofrankia TaxID=2994363 RepID=UPI000234C5EC|nr:MULTISPECIES: mannosyltransferase family protein [Pseudofrankia]